jgi:23S rRNA (pseudouridine1915-N3)-methyltransferase
VLIRLVAAGTRMPAWVNAGYGEYAKRIGGEVRLELVEIPVAHRGRNADLARLLEAEGQRMLSRVDARQFVVALEVGGRGLDTPGLAAWLQRRLAEGRDLALLVGGPDGLAAACRERADFTWSLSPLTFPHGLVRIMVAEQLYRALSVLRGHPYHRA